MKYLIYIAIICSLFSCKKVTNANVTVIKDCTGSYLRCSGKDYNVCNLEMLNPFQDGAKATATFKKIKKCNGSAKDQIVCATIHDNEGWVTVEEIK